MMVLELKVALRFLMAKKRAMLMSLTGIACGVGFFVLTQAQTSGFETFYIRTILGTTGAIQVHDRFQDTLRTMAVEGEETATGFRIAHREARHYVEGVAEPVAVANAVREFANVTGVSEVVSGAANLRTAVRGESIHLYGIRIEDHLAVSDLDRQIIRGDLQELRQSPRRALIGSVLARRMQLQPGDTFDLETADQRRSYRVAAIYETGVRDIDSMRIYLQLGEARSLLRKPHGASFLQIALRDPARAVQDADRIESVVGHFAYSWQERERAWLEVFRALRVSSGLTVSAIIFISGLGIFNTLAMIVMERTREIAILRSMGYTRHNVLRIFLWQGCVVLAGGVLIGWGIGALATYGVSRIPIRIRGIFATDHFVVNWAVSHYLMAALIAVIVVLIATLIPARRAARLEPGDVIRNAAA